VTRSDSLALPLGFRWSSAIAGIKASGRPDVAFAVADTPAIAAAMFTSNQLVAAPLTIGKQHLAATGNKVRAVLVNSGNANCATGPNGLDACQLSCRAAGEALGCVFDEVFPSSTGIIGVPFPTNKLIAAIPAAAPRWAAPRRTPRPSPPPSSPPTPSSRSRRPASPSARNKSISSAAARARA
jgi:glutamate N-acetyltransferase/amino-acid N-acetyltransferase